MCVHTQSCPTLGDPVDSNLPGFSVHGIFQARILSGLPFPTAGDLPNLGIKITCLAHPSLATDSLLLRHLGSPNDCTTNLLQNVIQRFVLDTSGLFHCDYLFFNLGC